MATIEQLRKYIKDARAKWKKAINNNSDRAAELEKDIEILLAEYRKKIEEKRTKKGSFIDI